MPTNAEIKALIQKEVRQQKSHLVRNGLAYILDSIIDNIGAGPGGTPNLSAVLGEDNDAGALQIKNVGAPTDPNDAATKDYVDNNIGGTPGIDDVLAEAQAITADRTIDATGHNLTWTAGTHSMNAAGNEMLNLNGVSFEGRMTGKDGTAESYVSVNGDLVGNAVSFRLNSDDDTANPVSIVGNGQTSTITHTADIHTYNTGITITDLAGVGNRAIAVNASGKIVLL